MDTSNYLKYLPSIYQKEAPEAKGLLPGLLTVFEKMLSGIKDGGPANFAGLEEILDSISDYFDPDLTPTAFIEWISGWLAVELRKGEEWETEKQSEEKEITPSQPSRQGWQHLPGPVESRNRRLIRELPPIYHKRGTRSGFEEALKIYLGLKKQSDTIAINEFLQPFRIGCDDEGRIFDKEQSHTDPERYFTLQQLIDKPNLKVSHIMDYGNRSKLTSVVGASTVVGEGMPYYFRVQLGLSAPCSPVLLRKKKQVVMDIIEGEKPAHTYCALKLGAPGMRVGMECTINKDTLIGGLII